MMDDLVRADRALEKMSVGADVDEDEWPPVARRLTQSRVTAGLTQSDVADQASLGREAYLDLEVYNSEAFTAVSLADLVRVAKVVGISVHALLLNDSIPKGGEAVTSPAAVVGALNEYLGSRTTSPDSDEIGWDVSVLRRDAATLVSYPIMALHDICKVVGMHWSTVLPR
jgi:hypothetical protein